MFSLRSFIFVIRRAIGLVQAEWDKKANVKTEGDEDAEEDEQKELSDDELKVRVQDLIDSITVCSWDYLRRGLFDKHKVVVVSIMCFRIQVKNGDLEQRFYNQLVLGKMFEGVCPQPDILKFMQESNWLMIKGLEGLYSDVTKNVTSQ